MAKKKKTGKAKQIYTHELEMTVLVIHLLSK